MLDALLVDDGEGEGLMAPRRADESVDRALDHLGRQRELLTAAEALLYAGRLGGAVRTLHIAATEHAAAVAEILTASTTRAVKARRGARCCP